MTRRLIREGDPPSGQLASPVPQYWNPSTEAFEDVLGAHGAPRSILYGPNGQPISQSNPLEVRVRELEAELAAMRGMLETGNAKVTLSGQIVEIATVSNLAVTAGTNVILFNSIPVGTFAGVSVQIRTHGPNPNNPPVKLSYTVWGSAGTAAQEVPLLGGVDGLLNFRAATGLIPVAHPTITIWVQNRATVDITYVASLYGIPRG